MSYNEETGQTEVNPVTETYVSDHEETVKVKHSGGQELTCSVGHRFYTNRGWISAEDLRAGDILQLVNGDKVVVELVQHELLECPVPLYNFAVEGNHNYYVAESVNADTHDFVLVHNEGCGNPKFDERNLQHEYNRHAKQLGVDGPWNKSNREVFRQSIIDHLNTSDIVKASHYRGELTTLYYNSSTGIGAHLKPDGTFWTIWKLNLNQLKYNGLI